MGTVSNDPSRNGRAARKICPTCCGIPSQGSDFGACRASPRPGEENVTVMCESGGRITCESCRVNYGRRSEREANNIVLRIARDSNRQLCKHSGSVAADREYLQ